MLGAVESGMFAFALGGNMRGRPMTIDALGPPERKPAAYPAQALASDDGVSMFAALAPPRGQAPVQHRVPADAGAPAEARPQQSSMREGGTDYVFTPTASQRKLSIRKFDGTELYRGLGSVFADWGRTFLRAIELAESSCHISLDGRREGRPAGPFLVEDSGTLLPQASRHVGDATTDARLRHVSV